MTIGIIGTAGRAEDCLKFTNSLYQNDILIAATFGDGKNLKPGGTLDTWNKFTNLKPTNKKFHIDLRTGLVYDC